MEQRSDKHGRLVDEALKHETEGMVRAGRTTRAEEWRDPEPPGEDQPEADLAPDTTLTGGVPEGLTPEGVEARAELAAALGRIEYPTYRDPIIDRLVDNHAPARLVTAVRDLPGDTRFESLGELSDALGYGRETHRF